MRGRARVAGGRLAAGLRPASCSRSKRGRLARAGRHRRLGAGPAPRTGRARSRRSSSPTRRPASTCCGSSTTRRRPTTGRRPSSSCARRPDEVEKTGKTEAYTLTCETGDGKVLGSREVRSSAASASRSRCPAGCGGTQPGADVSGPSTDAPPVVAGTSRATTTVEAWQGPHARRAHPGHAAARPQAAVPVPRDGHRPAGQGPVAQGGVLGRQGDGARPVAQADRRAADGQGPGRTAASP